MRWMEEEEEEEDEEEEAAAAAEEEETGSPATAIDSPLVLCPTSP